MAKQPFIELTGKVKKIESVKGTDRIILENLKFEDPKQHFAIKQCANNEESVKITIQPIQENLPGTD